MNLQNPGEIKIKIKPQVKEPVLGETLTGFFYTLPGGLWLF